MLGPLLRRFRPDPLRARVEDSIRRGTGLSRQEWLIGVDECGGTVGRADLDELDALADRIVAWCRDRIAESRRPYGIDQMTLAIACAVPGGPPIASTTFGVFRPLEFYAEDGIARRLEAYVHGLGRELISQPAGPVRFAAALFCWGDVARDTIFADED